MSLSAIDNVVVFKHLQHAIIVLNQHNQVVKLNLAAERLLAAPQAMLIDKNVADLFLDHADMRDQFLTLEPMNAEITVGNAYFDMHIKPLHDGGELVGRIIVLHDITTRKKAELALKQQNERMALLYQITAVSPHSLSDHLQKALTQATTSLSLELGLISRIENGSFIVQHSYPQNDSIHPGLVFDLGLTYCSITLQAGHVIAIDQMQSSAYHGHPCYAANKLEAYIGTLILVNGKAYGTLSFSSSQPRTTPFQQADKEFVDLLARWIGTALEQLHTDKQLRTNLARTEALYRVAQSLIHYAELPDFLQTVTAGVAEALPANRVTLITLDMAAQQVTHMVRGGIGAHFVADILFDELQEGLSGWVLQTAKPALSPKGFPDPRESPAVQKRRAATNCGSIIVVPVRFHEEMIGTLTAINTPEERDFDADDVALLAALANQTAVAFENMRLLVAEQERAHQLQLSNEQLDAFSHMVAHDLKSPLAIILGYVQLLLLDMTDAEDARHQLELIFNVGQKMRNIISELLLLASVRKEDVQKRPLAMSTIVREACNRLSLLLDEKNAQIILPDTWPTALGYGPWVEEIWVNYISNAAKYGGEPAIIELGSEEKDDGSIQFWVMDNGLGITSLNTDRIFLKFTRLEETRASGHGLGLAIVKQITEMLDGTVGFENSATGGAKFYFSLPAATNR